METKIEIDFKTLQRSCKYNNLLSRCCHGKNFGGNCDVTNCPLGEKITGNTKQNENRLPESA